MSTSEASLGVQIQSYCEQSPIISQEESQRLSQVTVVPIMGPTAVGKTSNIREILQQDSGFNYVPAYTNRGWREGDLPDDYYYLPKGDLGLDILVDRIREQGIVQGTMHPNGSFYGTLPEDYRSPYALLAPIYSELPKLQAAGFEEVIPVMLSAHPAHYTHRLGERAISLRNKPGVLKKQLGEGRDALTAALDNDDVIWIANNNGGHDRRPTQTANEIIGIVRGDRDPSPYARQMGVLLRDYIHGIYRGL